MIRATYERPDGTLKIVDNPVQTCADHHASVDHSRMLQAGLKIVGCESIDDKGSVRITRNLPPPLKVLPEEGETVERGVPLHSVRNRRLHK